FGLADPRDAAVLARVLRASPRRPHRRPLRRRAGAVPLKARPTTFPMSMNASSPTPDVPLEIEPIVGWRVWKLGRTFLGDLRLRAIVHQHEWEPQTVEPAQCAARVYHTQFHQAPSEQCSCGDYPADSIK